MTQSHVDEASGSCSDDKVTTAAAAAAVLTDQGLFCIDASCSFILESLRYNLAALSSASAFSCTACRHWTLGRVRLSDAPAAAATASKR